MGEHPCVSAERQGFGEVGEMTSEGEKSTVGAKVLGDTVARNESGFLDCVGLLGPSESTFPASIPFLSTSISVWGDLIEAGSL